MFPSTGDGSVCSWTDSAEEMTCVGGRPSLTEPPEEAAAERRAPGRTATALRLVQNLLINRCWCSPEEAVVVHRPRRCSWAHL